MFTDIVGSTATRDGLVIEHGEVEGNRLYRERYLDAHNARIRDFFQRHNGFEVKTIGDAFFAAFAQPSDAVLCAAAIQRSLRDEPINIAIRIGLHTGAATYTNHDYDGHAVNIAARVESLLKTGGRVYCSRETAALAKNLPGVRYESYGEYVLKGVSQPVEIIEVLWDGAMQPAPPPKPHDRLPYPWLTNWVGREKEMDELAAALRVHHLVTLHGIGGVGKTRLAVETLLARGGGLPRDIIFISLEHARNEPEGLLTAVRDAMGLTEVDAPDFERLCRYLDGGGRLLLLDNFESVREAAKEVPRLAATPGVRVLVTSRHTLNVLGEQVVDLISMAPEDSKRLFVTLAKQRDPDFDVNDEGAMRDVLSATDGLPYLIEIVAVIAPMRRLSQLADDLKTRLAELRSRNPATLQRHVSVQACLEWALDRLPDAGRRALPRLAIFVGGFDADAALAITATTIETLDTLLDASLIRFDRDSGRYSILPTTRRFAQERIEDGERLAASHARWFIDRLDRADKTLHAPGGAAQASARRWITNEFENVMSAVAWAEANDPTLFERAVQTFNLYLDQTFRFSESLRLNETLLLRLSLETAPEAWAKTQNNLGQTYWRLPTGDRRSNLAKAIACYQSATRFYTEDDFPSDWANVQNNLGNAHADLPTGDRGENLETAIRFYRAALRFRTEQGSPSAWALTQNNLGVTYRQLPTGDKAENLMKAIAHFEAALRVQTEADSPVDWAMSQNNLGIAWWEMPTGDRAANLAKAISHFEAALRVQNEHHVSAQWAVTQTNLGVAFAELPNGDRVGNLAKAIACFEAALSVQTQRDVPEFWANTQYNLGLLHREVAVEKPEAVYKSIAHFEAAATGYAAVGLTEAAEDARLTAEGLKKSPPLHNASTD